MLVGFVRSALQPGGERLLTQGFLPVVLLPVGEALGIDRPEVRMPLMISQVAGLIVTRYLVRLEPIASMPADVVVATYGPGARSTTSPATSPDPRGLRRAKSPVEARQIVPRGAQNGASRVTIWRVSTPSRARHRGKA